MTKKDKKPKPAGTNEQTQLAREYMVYRANRTPVFIFPGKNEDLEQDGNGSGAFIEHKVRVFCDIPTSQTAMRSGLESGESFDYQSDLVI